MGDLRKITVEIPVELLEAAQEETGQGITDTVREALTLLRQRRAFRRMQELKGKVKFSLSLEEIREDRE